MPAPQEFRDRDEVQVAILDALIARREEGMTVFEVRSHVDADIEALETALGQLQEDGLIVVEDAEHRPLIMPADHVVPTEETDEADTAMLAEIRRWLRNIRQFVGRE